MNSLRSDLINLLEQFFDKRHVEELLELFYLNGEADDLELLSLAEQTLPSIIGKDITDQLLENLKEKHPKYPHTRPKISNE